MKLFGGDPRLVFLQEIITINKIYFAAIFVIFFCLLFVRFNDETFLLTFILFSVVEFFRLLISRGFNTGNVPLFVAFLILTAIPMIILDFLWIFFVETRSAFDFIVIIGMIIIHFLEFFVFGIYQLILISKYQRSFFKFQFGYLSLNRAPTGTIEEDDGLVLDDIH